MPPLPPSSSGGGSVSGSSSAASVVFFGRRFFFGLPSSSARSSSWLGAFGRRRRRLGGRGFDAGGGRARRCRRCRRSRPPRSAGRRSPRSGRRRAGACCRAGCVAVGAAVVGRPSGASGPRASASSSSGPRIASRIASVSSISKPFRSRCLDLLSAAAGDRHLGRQQAGAGGVGAWRPARRALRRLLGGRVGAATALRRGASAGSSAGLALGSTPRRRRSALGLVQRRLQLLRPRSRSATAWASSESVRLGDLGEPLGDEPVGLGLGLRRGSAGPAFRRRR